MVSSLMLWYCRLRAWPALMCRILPTYRSVLAQWSSYPHGLSTRVTPAAPCFLSPSPCPRRPSESLMCCHRCWNAGAPEGVEEALLDFFNRAEGEDAGSDARHVARVGVVCD